MKKNIKYLSALGIFVLCIINNSEAQRLSKMKNHIEQPSTVSFMFVFQIIFLLCSFSHFISIHAATYYVATNGNDTAPGSESQPWRTIQKAANTLVAGDIVYIKAGTYSERVMPVNSGNAGNYIVYTAYSGNAVTIDGNGVTLPAQEPGGLFDLSEVNYIKISGLRIFNAGPNSNNPGILVEYCNNIIIEKNYTYNTLSSGIGIWDSENIIIDGNEVELACNGGEQECITVANTKGFEIKNNHVHNAGRTLIGGEGIVFKDGSSNGKVFNNIVNDLPETLGIYCDAWDKYTHDIEIYNNIVYNCSDNGIAISSEQGGLLENIKVFNNVVYNNKFSGIVVTPNGDVPNSPMKNIYIINNTVYNNGWNTGADPWGGGIEIDSPNLSNIIIRNNITSQNLSFQIAPFSYTTNISVDHNLISGFVGDLPEETRGDDYVEGDPLFLNLSSADFRLQANSPAIDKGSTLLAPNTDFNGYARPTGSGIDIGAFEFGSTSEVFNMYGNSIKSFSLKQNYPNPFNPNTTIKYSIPNAGQGAILTYNVTLKVYDILGREVSTLVNKQQTSGNYKVTFSARDLVSGVYFYRITIRSNRSQAAAEDEYNKFSSVYKMMVIK